jgi:hypothetical protein
LFFRVGRLAWIIFYVNENRAITILGAIDLDIILRIWQKTFCYERVFMDGLTNAQRAAYERNKRELKGMLAFYAGDAPLPGAQATPILTLIVRSEELAFRVSGSREENAAFAQRFVRQFSDASPIFLQNQYKNLRVIGHPPEGECVAVEMRVFGRQVEVLIPLSAIEMVEDERSDRQLTMVPAAEEAEREFAGRGGGVVSVDFRGKRRLSPVAEVVPPEAGLF